MSQEHTQWSELSLINDGSQFLAPPIRRLVHKSVISLSMCLEVVQQPAFLTASRCPVCNINLSELGPAFVQEAHVKNCLEGGGGQASTQTAKYLVYKLPGESSLIGTECRPPIAFPGIIADYAFQSGVICLEEFIKGSTVARLSCLCSFHNGEY